MELQKHYDEITTAGAQVLAVSTDDLSGAESIIRIGRIKFPVLYTSKQNEIPISYNVFNLHGDGLASASVFIIDKNGNITYSDIGDGPYHQVSGKTILSELVKIPS